MALFSILLQYRSGSRRNGYHGISVMRYKIAVFRAFYIHLVGIKSFITLIRYYKSFVKNAVIKLPVQPDIGEHQYRVCMTALDGFRTVHDCDNL